MDKKEIFKMVVSPMGTAVFLDDFQDNLLSQIMVRVDSFIDATLSLKNKEGTQFDYYVGFYEGDLPNASCTLVGNTYYIAICNSLSDQMMGVFMALFSHPNLFEECGDREEEEIRFNIDFGEYGWKITANENTPFLGDFFKVAPRNKDRMIYALTCFEFSIFFVVIHEITHAVNGHLGFIINLHSRPESENDEEFQKFINKVKYGLEYDADAGSLKQILQFIHNSYIPMEDFLIRDDKSQLIKLAFYSANIVAWSLRMISEKYRLKNDDHPDPVFRIINLAKALSDLTDRKAIGEITFSEITSHYQQNIFPITEMFEDFFMMLAAAHKPWIEEYEKDFEIHFGYVHELKEEINQFSYFH